MTHGILKALRKFTPFRPPSPKDVGEGSASGPFPDYSCALPPYRNHQEEIDAVVSAYRRSEGQ